MHHKNRYDPWSGLAWVGQLELRTKARLVGPLNSIVFVSLFWSTSLGYGVAQNVTYTYTVKSYKSNEIHNLMFSSHKVVSCGSYEKCFNRPSLCYFITFLQEARVAYV